MADKSLGLKLFRVVTTDAPDVGDATNSGSSYSRYELHAVAESMVHVIAESLVVFAKAEANGKRPQRIVAIEELPGPVQVITRDDYLRGISGATKQ